jgi:hypothetical protein
MSLARMKADAAAGAKLRRRIRSIRQRLQILRSYLWLSLDDGDNSEITEALEALDFVERSLQAALRESE